MARSYSLAEIAGEAACPEDRAEWMAAIGLITPDGDGRFNYGDVLTVKMVSALLDSDVPPASIERAAIGGVVSFRRTDEYLPYEPGLRSVRTFAEFQRSAGPRADLMPAIYEVLGLPKPDPSAPIHVDEEALFERIPTHAISARTRDDWVFLVLTRSRSSPNPRRRGLRRSCQPSGPKTPA